jgi:hypothetical protein
VQLIYQRLSLQGGADAYGRIDYQSSNTGYARLGVKLGKFGRGGEFSNFSTRRDQL